MPDSTELFVCSARGCSLYCLESDEDETGAINAMCKPIYNFFLAVHLKPSDSYYMHATLFSTAFFLGGAFQAKGTYILLLKTALTR